MRKILIFIFLALTIVAGAQVVDSTATIDYNFGESFKTFLDRNLWTLIAVAFFLLSEWLGENTKIKQSSVYKFLLNFIGNLIKKKAGPAAKVIILAVILSGVSVVASAQKFSGFFRPVDDKLFEKKTTALGLMGPAQEVNAWYFRPAVQISAMQLYYNKDLKQFDASSFESLGVGISYQHFIQANNEAVSNFGINALLLFDGSGEGTALSPVLSVSALQFFNAGAGYNTQLKKVFILTGITYSFN